MAKEFSRIFSQLQTTDESKSQGCDKSKQESYHPKPGPKLVDPVSTHYVWKVNLDQKWLILSEANEEIEAAYQKKAKDYLTVRDQPRYRF